jgi:N4-(beta-N-acetylglucosaminyl)-L-asparaginase
MDRRTFAKTAAAAAAAAATPTGVGAATRSRPPAPGDAPAVHTRPTTPVLVADVSSVRFRNGGSESAIERAFRGIVEGEDVLDALVAGVRIPELDPEESGIGLGGLPNADGVVQLDACCMHGPRRWAGGVAAIEGVSTPAAVAKAVASLTDHHLIAGRGATDFARDLGFEVLDDLNTAHSRELWLEWRRRVDPGHWLDPEERLRGQGERGEETDPDAIGRRRPGGQASLTQSQLRRRAEAYYRAGLTMVRDGLIPEHSFWGTTNLNAVTPDGSLAGVTTTSGLAWKIPGRVGDSPILGAGLYVGHGVGAAGSTGRGEANLYNLSSYLVVENMRRGMAPKDAGMAALERIHENTIEARLLNERGLPAFDVRFFIVNAAGEYAGVALYGSAENMFAVMDGAGAREEPLEGLLEGSPSD